LNPFEQFEIHDISEAIPPEETFRLLDHWGWILAISIGSSALILVLLFKGKIINAIRRRFEVSTLDRFKREIDGIRTAKSKIDAESIEKIFALLCTFLMEEGLFGSLNLSLEEMAVIVDRDLGSNTQLKEGLIKLFEQMLTFRYSGDDEGVATHALVDSFLNLSDQISVTHGAHSA